MPSPLYDDTEEFFPTNPKQFSIRCIIKGFNFWLTVPLVVVVQMRLTSLIMKRNMIFRMAFIKINWYANKGGFTPRFDKKSRLGKLMILVSQIFLYKLCPGTVYCKDSQGRI